MAEARARRSKGAGTRASEEPGRDDEVCPVAFCPVGMALTTARQLKPDAIEHLLAAARELLLAARVVLDARAEDVGGAGRPLERIDIG